MPVITLLSDFGGQDTFLGVSKAFFLKFLPHYELVDITHEINRADISQAAWVIYSAYRHFPAGTVHMLMFDILREPKRKMLLSETDGHYFIAPDNGLISLAFGDKETKTWQCCEFNGVALGQWLSEALKIINRLGDVPSGGDFNKLGLKDYDLNELPRQPPLRVFTSRIDCNILYIDRYGNIILNLTVLQFVDLAAGRAFRIKMPGEKMVKGVKHRYETSTISTSYNDVNEDALLCRFNTLGYLEIAINRRSVAARFESDTFVDRNLANEIITIYFNE